LIRFLWAAAFTGWAGAALKRLAAAIFDRAAFGAFRGAGGGYAIHDIFYNVAAAAGVGGRLDLTTTTLVGGHGAAELPCRAFSAIKHEGAPV